MYAAVGLAYPLFITNVILLILILFTFEFYYPDSIFSFFVVLTTYFVDFNLLLLVENLKSSKFKSFTVKSSFYFSSVFVNFNLSELFIELIETFLPSLIEAKLCLSNLLGLFKVDGF